MDSLAITTLHQTTRLAGLARLVRGQLRLTKKGGQLLSPAQRPALWALVLDTFTSRFLWASHDGYPAGMVGQTGWAYSLYLLARFGRKPLPLRFYAEHYRQAFPFVLAEFPNAAYRTPGEEFADWYGLRTFERGLNWLGVLDAQLQLVGLPQPEQLVTASPLLAQLFEVLQGPA